MLEPLPESTVTCSWRSPNSVHLEALCDGYHQPRGFFPQHFFLEKGKKYNGKASLLEMFPLVGGLGKRRRIGCF